MLEFDKWFHRQRARFQLENITERAIRIGNTEKQVRVLVVGAAVDDVAVRQQHLHAVDGFVRQTVAERGGLDTDTGDSATDSDRLQLRHHHWHALLLEAGIGQSGIGRHAFDFDHLLVAVDRDDLVQRAHIELAAGFRRARTKQVGSTLIEADAVASIAQLATESISL